MKRRTFITLMAAGSVAACARPAHATIRGLTMGTSYAVELAAQIDDSVRTRLVELIEAELAAINRAMSTFDPRSELSEFNRRQDLRWTPASRGLFEVLDSASRISTATQGAFDVTVGPLVDVWGFGPEFRTQRVPNDTLIERVRESVGYKHVQTDPSTGAIRKRHSRTQVDLGAIAPGYGVDRLAMILDSQGVHDYLVEIGGEFRARAPRRREDPGGSASSVRWKVDASLERPSSSRTGRFAPPAPPKTSSSRMDGTIRTLSIPGRRGRSNIRRWR